MIGVGHGGILLGASRASIAQACQNSRPSQPPGKDARNGQRRVPRHHLSQGAHPQCLLGRGDRRAASRDLGLGEARTDDRQLAAGASRVRAQPGGEGAAQAAPEPGQPGEDRSIAPVTAIIAYDTDVLRAAAANLPAQPGDEERLHRRGEEGARRDDGAAQQLAAGRVLHHRRARARASTPARCRASTTPASTRSSSPARP